MTVLHYLWIPILLSTVFVFIASSLIHMVTPWHKNDQAKMADEGKVIDALRPIAIPPGDYMVPNCSGPAEMKTPEFKEKMAKGPILVVTVIPNGPFGIGKSLVQWFLYLLVVSYVTAYVTLHGVHEWQGYRQVLRLAFPTALLGYAGALWQMSIWYRRSWVTSIKSTVDGLLYAGITAGTLGWFWMK